MWVGSRWRQDEHEEPGEGAEKGGGGGGEDRSAPRQPD